MPPTQDVAPRVSRSEFARVLAESCAIRLHLLPKTDPDTRDFYVARFANGLLKVGLSRKVGVRFGNLHNEATTRQLRAVRPLTQVVVVRGAGRQLERAVLRVLSSENVVGEWFKGPLSDAVAKSFGGRA